MGLNAELKAHANGAGGASSDQRPPDFLSSHPSTPDRIKNARSNARQYVGPGAGKRDKNEYLTLIDNLVYGDDPSDGFVRGRRFLHPKLGFTFTAPEGFVLDNTTHAVFGVKDGGAQALRLDVVHAPSAQPLSEYLDSGWIENIDRDSISQSTVNGLPAATATARNNDWIFRLYVVRFESDVYRFIFASKNVSEASAHAFRDSVGTFRQITRSEAALAKPHRIKVVKVAAGATVEALARRMATTDRQAERFRALNGFGPGYRLKPGELVKIVVE
jgi:predicted Zn-dependent protease